MSRHILAPLTLSFIAAADLTAQSALHGVVRDSVSGAPISNVLIMLSHRKTVRQRDSVPSRFRQLTDIQGEFRLIDIPRGRYVVHARFLGYKALNLPVEIQPGKDQFLVVRMSGTSVCLGHCGPDPVKLAYARSH